MSPSLQRPEAAIKARRRPQPGYRGRDTIGEKVPRISGWSSLQVLNRLRAAFPIIDMVIQWIVVVVIPCAVVGLLVYYGAKSVGAFLEGIHERR